MKKLICCFCLLFTLATIGVFAQQMTLDEVIKNAARDLEEALPQGTMIAVLNFASPSPAFSEYVIEELTGELVTGRKLTIVDRSSLSLIRQEMNLQLSGDVSDESAQAIGKMLGAQSIVSGSLANVGAYQRFRIRVISVETAAIQTQVSFNLQNDAQVAFLLGDPASAVPSSQQSPTGNDEDAWKNKWIYLGGGFGGGKITWTDTYRGNTYEEVHSLITVGFNADFVFTNFFAIGLYLGIGVPLDGNTEWPLYPAIPILLKLGGKFGSVELTGNLGYTVGLGFTLGGTLGFKAGPGILFAELFATPWATPLVGALDSAIFGVVGYKVGVGRNRK
jgi:TolB-like protein